MLNPQQKRILEYLKRNEWLCNTPEIMIELRCQKFATRLSEMRRKGYVFERGETKIGTAKYKLISQPTSYFLPPARKHIGQPIENKLL